MSKSPRAQQALELVSGLQKLFVQGLEQIKVPLGAEPFVKTSWLRDQKWGHKNRRGVRGLWIER